MKLELDLTRDQLIDTISAIFTIERKHRDYNDSAWGYLEELAFQLHKTIQPSKKEWSKTSFFDQYFNKESKKRFLEK